MPATITVTNRNSTATSLVVDGTNRSISGSGSIQIGADSLTRLLADNIASLRFQAQGDLTHSAVPPSAGGATTFSAVVDATALGTTTLVPAVAGYRWLTRRTNFSVVSSSGSPSAAQLSVRQAGAIIQGVNADSTFVPLSSFAGLQTAPGVGLDVTVDTAATGGALSVQVLVEGQYSV